MSNWETENEAKLEKLIGLTMDYKQSFMEGLEELRDKVESQDQIIANVAEQLTKLSAKVDSLQTKEIQASKENSADFVREQ
jgi:hypothetical protein